MSEIDPLTLEILWQRLIAVADQMSTTLARTAFSTTITASNDYGCVLVDADAQCIAHAHRSLPIFNRTMPYTCSIVLEQFGRDNIAPGDVFISNDPWQNAGHHPDITVITPFFRDDALVGFAASIAHHADVGGSIDANRVTDSYEEGLLIPLVRLYQGGVLNQTALDFVAANVRLPTAVIGDIHAQAAANQTGAERCLLTAVQAGLDQAAIADMLFAAATDHRYLSNGHVLDFTNKALEALDIAGWDLAETVIGSLPRGYADAGRMEESNAWRRPIDLVEILEATFEDLPDILAADIKPTQWDGRAALIETVLGEDPQAIADSLTDALRQGADPVELADAVTQAAITRVARFHVTNEFGDWDRALHTLSFANAVRGGLQRSGSRELVRGIYDAAMSVYLDRFLNVPPARLPTANGHASGDELLEMLPDLLDRQQQVDEAAGLVVDYRATDAPVEALLESIGDGLLREDRDFHTIQAVEASIHQANLSDDSADATVALVAGARYLAAHAPTVRSQGQTFQIAQRLQRGERLFEEAPA